MNDHGSGHIFDSEVLIHSLQITALVFVMMVIIDWVDVRTRGKFPRWITHNRINQYLIATFLGLTPGCMGVYMNVSLYMHGYLSLGAMVGGMIASSGEASLVMFAQFPGKAILLHGIMLAVGLVSSVITDILVSKFRISHKVECESVIYHSDEKSLSHYLREHIWHHIIKKHIWKIFIWTFLAISLVHTGTQLWDIKSFVRENPQLLLFLAVVIGIIPDVAPQFVFVFMFSEGLIPFSILLTSSMAQNGHGLIPLFSYSVKDTVIIKTFNLIFALLTGIIFMLLGY
ncbi:MAG: arsenic efflux protein [Calditrichaeota bacterium]|nr:arsenic efflux protein [Calditrichota bacterium]